MSSDLSKFLNVKAEMYMNLKDWLEAGGALEDNPDFDEIADNKWKFNSSGKVQIKSKQELKLEGIDSPNTAEALAVTFSKGFNKPGEVDSNSLWIAGAGKVETARELPRVREELYNLPD